MNESKKLKVAVVGSGMAGLVTAWLLHNDGRRRYEVEIFESGSEPSLDSASVSVVDNHTGEVERIDVPMRAFTEGYYHNLKAMYDFLGIAYHVQPFLFSFSRMTNKETAVQGHEQQYFVHASNNHRLPPVKPVSVSWISYLIEVAFALICYAWFSLSCLLVPARYHQRTGLCESLDEYLERIRLPKYFVRYYLLPLMSAITTCPHRYLLAFPANDIVNYRNSIISGRQLTVSVGVNEVQRKLVKGIKLHCSARVTKIDPQESGIQLQWQCSKEAEAVLQDQTFDIVVLAVPPNTVGSIFSHLKKDMHMFPTISVETVVHHDKTDIRPLQRGIADESRSSWFMTSDADRAQTIHLRTFKNQDMCTEATHIQPSGVMVTSCPLSKRDPSKVIRSSVFTRVLRTPESRKQTNRMFAPADVNWADEEKRTKWSNGDNGVYLVGSWCWDGMVLLEGCVVSAMRTASALDVSIPWDCKLQR